MLRQRGNMFCLLDMDGGFNQPLFMIASGVGAEAQEAVVNHLLWCTP